MGDYLMWNHRVVDISDGVEEPIYEIREVFYNFKGLPFGHGEASVVGESLDEMQAVLHQFASAFDLAILNSATDFNNAIDS